MPLIYKLIKMSNRKAFDYTLRISSFSTVTGFTKDDYTGIVEI